MVRHKLLLPILCVVVVVGGLWTAQAVSQEEATPPERRQRGGRRRFDPEQMRRRMTEWRQQAAERMREDLGVSEDEWKKVLQPMVEKVQTLVRQQSQAGLQRMMGGFGRRGGRRRPGQEAQGQREQTEVQKATAALRTLIEDKESKAESIKAALGVLRKAQEKVELELAKARKALRGVVTLRQEAQLVLMGLLD